MRVTFNSIRDESLTNLSREGARQARLQVQISSGQKISQADEDPLVAQKILALQSTSAQTQHYYRNAGYALDISKASYSSVDSLRQAADRAGEIAGSISGLTTPDDFKPYGSELNGLVEQAVSDVNGKFDGKFLLGGTKTDAPPFTVARDAAGNVTSVTYTGAAQGPEIQVAEGTTVSPYTDGTSNGGMADLINHMISLRDALQNSDGVAVSAERPGLQTAEDGVLNTLGQIGAQQRRMESTQDMASTSYDDVNARISSYNDVDLSKAIVDLTKSQTAYQAALQATAKITSHSLLDYL